MTSMYRPYQERDGTPAAKAHSSGGSRMWGTGGGGAHPTKQCRIKLVRGGGGGIDKQRKKERKKKVFTNKRKETPPRHIGARGP